MNPSRLLVKAIFELPDCGIGTNRKSNGRPFARSESARAKCDVELEIEQSSLRNRSAEEQNGLVSPKLYARRLSGALEMLTLCLASLLDDGTGVGSGGGVIEGAGIG